MNPSTIATDPPADKPPPAACPTCARPSIPADVPSIVYLATHYATDPACCLRCTLDEVERLDALGCLDLPLLPAPLPVPLAEVAW